MNEVRLGRKPIAMVDVNLAFLVFLMQRAKLAALLVQQHPAFYRKKYEHTASLSSVHLGKYLP